MNIVGYLISDGGKHTVTVSPYTESKVHDAAILNEAGHAQETGSKHSFKKISDTLKRIGNDTKNGKMLNASGPFGRAPTNPIPANTIYDELEYLQQLYFLDGSSGSASRLGSVASPVTKFVVDCYLIVSDDNKFQEYLFIDPHCKETSAFAPEGYKLLLDAMQQTTTYKDGLFRRIQKMFLNCLKCVFV